MQLRNSLESFLPYFFSKKYGAYFFQKSTEQVREKVKKSLPIEEENLYKPNIM